MKLSGRARGVEGTAEGILGRGREPAIIDRDRRGQVRVAGGTEDELAGTVLGEGVEASGRAKGSTEGHGDAYVAREVVFHGDGRVRRAEAHDAVQGQALGGGAEDELVAGRDVVGDGAGRAAGENLGSVGDGQGSRADRSGRHRRSDCARRAVRTEDEGTRLSATPNR